MNKSCIPLLLIFILSTHLSHAQQQAEYNRKGDEALRKKDYNDARLYYSEGIAICDMYSIRRLTSIWKDNINLRPSLHNLMNRCLGCLNNSAARNDSVAISMLSEYHLEGIGTPKSREMSEHWAHELDNARKNDLIDPIPLYTGSKRNTPPIRYFAGYAFSLHTPIGITFGGTGERYGLYARLRTNASFQKYEGTTDFIIDENGKEQLPPELETALYKRQQTANIHAITAGLVIKVSDLAAITLGTGYFMNDKIFRYTEIDDTGNTISSKRNFKIGNYSYRGIVAEADGIWEISRMYVSGGLGCHISSKPYIDFHIGAGIFF